MNTLSNLEDVSVMMKWDLEQSNMRVMMTMRPAWCSPGGDENGAWCSLVYQNCSLRRTDGNCWEVGLEHNPTRIQGEQEEY